MKKILINLMVLCTTSLFLSSCIQETFPTDFAAASQVGVSESALEALSNSTAAFMYAYNYFGTSTNTEIGYPGMMIIRDALTDVPTTPTSYNHFRTPWNQLNNFVSASVRQPWRYYYRMILNANLTISAIKEPDEASGRIQQFYGNALVYRAMSYLDLIRMYEYKRTGVAALDAEADINEIWGLTATIIDEHFDERNADNNPRVPFYVMYRFIMNDLNRAEKYLTYSRSSKTSANLSVAHAYKARLWLEIATRFQKYPADLQAQIAHENDEDLAAKYAPLGITSAADCYRKAAEYARMVIGRHAPLTYAEWHSTTNGFNDMSVSSWVFAISISSPEGVHSRVNHFLSHACTEYSRGYSRSQYFCYRMIDRRLYERIDDDDWRKVTWKDPADFNGRPAAGAAVPSVPEKYHSSFRGTELSVLGNTLDWEWHHRDAYVGFKFRPNGGNIGEDYLHAGQIDFPIVRVEEMYFIEAEAKAYAEGLDAGIAALSGFLNTHRYRNASFSVAPNDIEDFVDNYLIMHKRVEFWGEGLAFFDIKRRELAITRGYPGTNWIETQLYNSLPGYTPSWLNLYVPNEGEATLNRAIRLNPNPLVQASYGLWTQ
ncbi:MAG: RagB/SusD family nutrient uptake outer membrane protein [Bacteroidales bacterium]|nr:RagB/SusD family nutrient uptake outer membrane protein [Bacteroidales bacterium]